MKTYEITTRVVVHDEAALMHAAREQFERDGNDRNEIQSAADALNELSHLGDPCHPDGERAPLDCGVEILNRTTREIRAEGFHVGACEKCRAQPVTLHVWQPEEGGEQHVCRQCLLGLDKPTEPITRRIRFAPGHNGAGIIVHLDGYQWRATHLVSCDSYMGDVWECERVTEPVACAIIHRDGDPMNNDVENLHVAPLYPPEVAQRHAAELRQALADLLEWNSRAGISNAREWREAKSLMTRIRNEEDEAREAGR